MKSLIQKILNSKGYRIEKIRIPYIPHVVRHNLTGIPFEFWLTNQDAEWWYAEEGWNNSLEFKELKNLLEPGDRLLEIGSHHGYTGLLCSHFVGNEGFVLGIEAHPQNALVAQAQLGINPKVKNLRFIHSAGGVSDGLSKITFEHNASIQNNEQSGIQVQARSGDSLDKEFGPFSALKIDVEGFEVSVLRGCKEILSRIPKIALEIHLDSLESFGNNISDLFAEIELSRYKGTMFTRPDYQISEFDPKLLPKSGIVNIFLSRIG